MNAYLFLLFIPQFSQECLYVVHIQYESPENTACAEVFICFSEFPQLVCTKVNPNIEKQLRSISVSLQVISHKQNSLLKAATTGK